MPEVSLIAMSPTEFDGFIQLAVANFAENKTLNNDWPAEIASAKSKEAFAQLLPQGQETPQHFFRQIQLGSQTIGYIWWAIAIKGAQKNAYLYEILILEPFRNQGYGTAAMHLLMDIAASENALLALHVFGFNKAAVRFYQRLGFAITD